MHKNMPSTITMVHHILGCTSSFLHLESAIFSLPLLPRTVISSVNSLREMSLTLQSNICGKEMRERPNCCYIGPSTGAAGLFLAGNYISSDCRDYEGEITSACFCCCLHPNQRHVTQQIKAGGHAVYNIYIHLFVCVCVCVYVSCTS